jgi:hypothetical protein
MSYARLGAAGRGATDRGDAHAPKPDEQVMMSSAHAPAGPNLSPETLMEFDLDRFDVVDKLRFALDNLTKEYVSRPLNAADPLDMTWLAGRLELIIRAIQVG